MDALGYHYIAEMSGCDREVLSNEDRIRDIISEAARVANASIRGLSVHRFSPCGVSGVVVIAESHLSIHTWPEYEYAATDIFTCGSDTFPQRACDYMAEKLHASKVSLTVIQRGIKDNEGLRLHRIMEENQRKSS